EAFERSPGLIDAVDQVQQFTSGPAQPIQLGDEDGVTLRSARMNLANSGRSLRAPLIFSRQTLSAPAALRAVSWPLRSWSCVLTRAYPRTVIGGSPAAGRAKPRSCGGRVRRRRFGAAWDRWRRVRRIERYRRVRVPPRGRQSA